MTSILDRLNETVEVALPESAVKSGDRGPGAQPRPRAGAGTASPASVYLETIEQERRRSFGRGVSRGGREGRQGAAHPGCARRAGGAERRAGRAHSSTSFSRAQQSGMPPQDFANQIMQGGQIGVLCWSEVRRGKALAAADGGVEDRRRVGQRRRPRPARRGGRDGRRRPTRAFERRTMGVERGCRTTRTWTTSTRMTTYEDSELQHEHGRDEQARARQTAEGDAGTNPARARSSRPRRKPLNRTGGCTPRAWLGSNVKSCQQGEKRLHRGCFEADLVPLGDHPQGAANEADLECNSRRSG